MVLNGGPKWVEFYSVDNTSLPDCLQGTKAQYPATGDWNPALFTNPGVLYVSFFQTNMIRLSG